MTSRACRYCPAPLRKHNAVQCGSPECKQQLHEDRVTQSREYQRAKRAEFAARGESYRNQWARPEGPRKSNTHCISCGDPVGWGKTQETRCRRCWDIKLERRPIDVARRKLAKAAVGARGTTVWRVGRCASDGEWWVSSRDGQFCSPRCKAREKKLRRRAAEKGCKLTPGRRISVYERDNWACQICSKPTDRTVHREHDLSPTIDHIIPLSAGGEHSPENWQTAHRICNSHKRDLLELPNDLIFAAPANA